MKQFTTKYLILILITVFITSTMLFFCKEKAAGPYQPTYESLSKHKVPQWFKDAKFGIFIHWGAYAVPAYHEWYVVFYSPMASFRENLGGPPYTAAQGNLPDSVFNANIRKEANEYHRKNFGVDFSYDEFIPMFKAENFQPDRWAQLFKQSGAKYVVLTAKHGEEFALWPTKFTDRNSMDMGPKRDLVGDLTKSVRAEGLKMGYYHNTTYSFWDERYPNKEWVEYMNNSIKELVDMYQPDILWGDVPVGPVRDENGKPLGADHWNSKEVIAYFYNHSPNPEQVVTNDRWGLDLNVKTDSPKSLKNTVWASRAKRWGVDVNAAFLGDYQTPERFTVDKIMKAPWETCDSMDPRSWGYSRILPDQDYMTTNELVDYLVDVVSKNGNLLINIGPKADGTIPELMQERLRGIGEWLEVNGEAIYGTTYWKTFKENEFRFTRKGNTLYAIALENPGTRVLLAELVGLDVQSVSLLGLDRDIDWQMTQNGLQLDLPSNLPSEYANTLKIQASSL